MYQALFLYPAIIGFVLLVIHSGFTRGTRFTLIYFGGGFIFGMIREYFYVNFKQIYDYSGLAIKIFGIPPVIPLGWMFTFYIGLCFAERMMGTTCAEIETALYQTDQAGAKVIWEQKLIPMMIGVAIFTGIVCYSIESCAINLGWWEFIGYKGEFVVNPVQYMWTQTGIIFTVGFFLLYFKQVRSPKNIIFWVAFTLKYIAEDYLFQYLDLFGIMILWALVLVIPILFYADFSFFYLILLFVGRLFVNLYSIFDIVSPYNITLMKLVFFVPIGLYFLFHWLPVYGKSRKTQQ